MTMVVADANLGLPLRRRVANNAGSGFTLLELLIAISVFAVVATVAYGGLRTVLESKQLLDARLQALAQLQTAFSMMRRDLEQAVVRAVRDEAGAALPPFIGAAGESELVALTRAGWSNPRAIKRSTLQRVAYRWQDNTLHRVYWGVLDRIDDASAVDIPLLGGVEGARLRFQDASRQWHTVWPPEQQSEAELPRAVEMALMLKGRGEMSRLFCLPQSGQIAQRDPSQ